MKVVAVEVFLITLPFRFAFKHSLASRDHSENLIVRVAIVHGAETFVGYGEGVPRDYVTGESASGAVTAIEQDYAPVFINASFATAAQLIDALKLHWHQLNLENKPQGASWCAFELAMLDAAARAERINVGSLLAGPTWTASAGISYGAVIPFGGQKALKAVLWFYKLYGFQTVKIKVGKDRELDLYRLKIARRILGEKVTLRVDANCAWSVEETLTAAEQMRLYGVRSYEQPVAADNLEGLAAITKAIPEQVMVDESLCTVGDARLLASKKVCSAFNIRISKVGGLFAARQIAEIARQSGIACHMGAQVGESGILSAAGRTFASLEPPFDNYEGSNNFFLLKEDITAENLNVGPGGFGRLLNGNGLGVTVKTERLRKFSSGGPAVEVQQPLMHERIVL